MLQHKQQTGSYCCELTEVEELSELTTRLKPLDLSGFQFSFLNLRRWIQRNSEVDKAGTEILQGSFFPHAQHVPIFLDKCVFLI